MSTPQRQPEPEQVEASATTCVVGCKLPHGLHLDLKNRDGQVVRYTLKGNNASRIIGGYGLTEGIPREFMQEWLKRNKEHPAVKGHSIFMHSDVASAEAHARDNRGVVTGLEAIDPIEEMKRKRIELDPEASKVYERQKAENPMRNRQVVE